jgi:hypothetical protein
MTSAAIATLHHLTINLSAKVMMMVMVMVTVMVVTVLSARLLDFI